MNSANKRSGTVRREEDSQVREQNERYRQLCEVGRTITAEINIKVLFPLVMNQTNIIMGTQRSSLFLSQWFLKHILYGSLMSFCLY